MGVRSLIVGGGGARAAALGLALAIGGCGGSPFEDAGSEPDASDRADPMPDADADAEVPPSCNPGELACGPTCVGDCAACAAGTLTCGTRCVATCDVCTEVFQCANACVPACALCLGAQAACGTECRADCTGCTTTCTSCPAGSHVCSGMCETDRANDPAVGCRLGCGTETCPSTRTALASCDASGACALMPCASGTANCNGVLSDGCEASLANTMNCGACGNRCELANATTTCATGSCRIASCNTGYADCDGSTPTGCEMDIRTAGNSCATADYLSSPATGTSRISGDTNSDTTYTYYGTDTHWYRVRVSENDASIFTRVPMTVTITLGVDSTVDYDLYVYWDCAGTYAGSSAAGMGVTDSVCLSWPDNAGSDDSRDIWIEVVYYGGSSCIGWNLFAQGHTGGC